MYTCQVRLLFVILDLSTDESITVLKSHPIATGQLHMFEKDENKV